MTNVYLRPGFITKRYEAEAEAQMIHTREALGMVVPFQQAFDEFYQSATQSLAMTIILWITRRISAKTFLKWVRAVAMFIPFCSELSGIVESMMQAASGETATLHWVIVKALEASTVVGAVSSVVDLVLNLAGLITCAAMYFKRQLCSLFLACPPDLFEPTGCCTTHLRRYLTHLRGKRSESLQTLENAETLREYMASAPGRIWSNLRSYWPLSDPRLKTKVRASKLRKHKFLAPMHWYRFHWNNEAKRTYGLSGAAEGVMADEVRRVLPRAVRRHPATGYLHVDWMQVMRYAHNQRKRALSQKKRKQPKRRR